MNLRWMEIGRTSYETWRSRSALVLGFLLGSWRAPAQELAKTFGRDLDLVHSFRNYKVWDRQYGPGLNHPINIKLFPLMPSLKGEVKTGSHVGGRAILLHLIRLGFYKLAQVQFSEPRELRVLKSFYYAEAHESTNKIKYYVFLDVTSL